MKKLLRFGLIALASLTLSSCSLEDIIGGLGSLANGSQSSSSVEPDPTVYGQGGQNEQLVVDADIPNGEYVVSPKEVPEGEKASFIVYKSASLKDSNIFFSDEFETTSMCLLKPGQVVVGNYVTFQNVNSNPQVGELQNGIFKVGTHFQLTNQVLRLEGIDPVSGRYELLSQLDNLSFYSHENLTTSQITNLVNPGEVISIPYVKDGVYVHLDGAKIVL